MATRGRANTLSSPAPHAAAAATWAGKCAVGACQAGSGTASVTVELVGEHAPVTLALLVNRATGELGQADVTL